MADIHKYTSKEVLNKVLLDSSGDAVNAFSHTTSEALNAALDDTNSRLNVSLEGGTISGDVTISGDLTVTGSSTYSYTEAISGTGTAKANFDILTLTNAVNAADMDGTETSVLFNQYYYDGSTPAVADAGRISIGTETDWTSTASTQDSYMAFETALNGTVTEYMRITSAGNVGIGETSPYSPLHITSSAEGTMGEIESGAYIPQVLIEGSGTTAADSSPTLALFNSSTAVDGDTIGSIVFIGGDSDTQPPTTPANASIYAGMYAKITDETNSSNDGELHFLTTVANDNTNVPMSIVGNNVGIGTSAPSAKLDIADSDMLALLGSSSGTTRANDTSKIARVGVVHYTNAQEPVGFLYGQSTASKNQIGIGGGSSTFNAATEINFWTAANQTTTTGTNRMHIDSAGNVGIGTTAPGTVNSTALTNGGNLHLQASSGTAQLIADGALRGALVLNDRGASSDSKVYQIWSDGGELVFTAMNDNESTKSTHMVIDANSRISLSNNDDGTSNTIFGKNAGDPDGAGDQNVFIGELAGGSGTQTDSGDFNVGIGYKALEDLTAGARNTALGHQAGVQLTGATHNTIVGMNAMSNVTNDVVGVTAIGYNAVPASGLTTGANYTVGVGYSALAALTSGAKNTAIGYQAGNALTLGSSNIAIGYQSLLVMDGDDATNGGNQNVAIGELAMGAVNNDGHDDCEQDGNIGIGYKAAYGGALSGAVDFVGNIAIGKAAMDSTGSNPQTGTIAIGHSALTALTSGAGNVAIGYTAMATNKLGDNNIAIGYGAMDLSYIDDTQDAITDGNLFIGRDSGGGDWATAASKYNVAVGNYTMDAVMNGALNNTALGYNSASTITTGDTNVCIGAHTGNNDINLTTGTNNTLVGAYADVSATGAVNQTAIGYDCSGQADNSVTLGNASVTAVYMASDSGATVHCAKVEAIGSQGLEIDPPSGNAQIYFNSANSDFYITQVDGSDTLNFYDGSDDIVVLSASANTATGDFVDTSDVGLKENIKTLSTGLDIVNKMNPVSFDWKNKDKGSNSGFIAQEIEKLLPNDVSGIDYDKDVRSSGKGINVTGIVAHLVKAVQELSAKVEALEAK